MTDAELLRRMQADDLDAFEAFFARHRMLVYRTAYGLTGDRHAAEEVLQDTFTRAYRHRATLMTDVSPVPWLHRVALNLCYSRLDKRRIKAEPISEDNVGHLRDGDIQPDERAERHETARQLRVGLAQLPEIHRSVVVLRYLHDLSLTEVADILHIRPGTVKSRLHYGLHSLRRIMVALGGDNAERGATAASRSAAVPGSERPR